VLDAKKARCNLEKVIKTWRKIMPELRQKRILIAAVKTDCLGKMKRKVFEALRSRRDYTFEKGITDTYMTNAI
jgi:hypothetical protein